MKIPRLVSVGAAAVALAVSTMLVSTTASAQEIPPTAPTATITPATLTVTEFQTTGVVVALTGFTPGETVAELFGTPYQGGQTGRTAVADGTGAVSFAFVADSAVPGEYVLGGQGEDPTVVAAEIVTVLADEDEDEAPAPTGTATITPSTLSQTAFRTTGVTAVLTGFEPGETVEQIFASENSGGPTGVTAVADADGVVTFTYVAAAEAPAGAYRVGGEGADSGAYVAGEFTVVADDDAPEAPAPDEDDEDDDAADDAEDDDAPAAAPATPVVAEATYAG